jgi:hypothetical protein
MEKEKVKKSGISGQNMYFQSKTPAHSSLAGELSTHKIKNSLIA